MKNRIQLSKETAELIVKGGKEHWIKPRGTKVFAKGKGELQTFWFVQGSDSEATKSNGSLSGSMRVDSAVTFMSESNSADQAPVSQEMPSREDALTQRLVLWNVENLSQPLKKLIAGRRGRQILDLDSWRKLQIRPPKPDSIVLD